MHEKGAEFCVNPPNTQASLNDQQREVFGDALWFVNQVSDIPAGFGFDWII